MKTVNKTSHRKTAPGRLLVGAGGHRLFGAAVLTVLLIISALPTAAQEAGDGTQDLIRSAMVFNFCKFVQWPTNTPGDSIVLGVVGEKNKVPDFSSIAGKNVGGQAIAVRVVKSQEELRDCQLVYISEDQRAAMSETLSVAQAESILTISDIDGFCSEGGIIQLVERRGKLRFFINRGAADQAQLSLSSQLLKVAKIVEGS